MMVKLIFSFCLVFALIGVKGAFASSVIYIKARNITYDKKIDTFFGNGNSVIKKGSYVIRADKMSFNKTTTVATLTGHVELLDGLGNFIKGTNAIINLTTYKGFIDNTMMFNKIKSIYIKAKRIILNGKNKYYVRNGTFSGCECKECLERKPNAAPKWSIKATNSYIVKNDYMFSYPAVFRIRKTPIFVLPAVEVGLNRKRRSGLLMPTIGFSSQNGFNYEQPMYWAINDSEDLTVSPYILGRRGKGAKVQYRFYWTKNIEGNWNIDYFNESIPYSKYNTKKQRVNVHAIQNVYFNQYGNFNFDINFVNDKNNLRILNNDNIILSSNRYTISNASYAVSRGDYYFSLNGYYYQDLVAENNDKTLQKLPDVHFDVINKSIYRNLTFNMSNRYTNDFVIVGEKGSVVSSYPKLSYPINLYHFNVVPSVGEHYTYVNWKNTITNLSHTKTTFVPQYNISVSTSLNRVYYTEKNNGVVALKHIITPTLSYEYIPNSTINIYPSFVTTYKRTNLLTLSLENALYVKSTEGGKITYNEFFYNKISQSYDFTKTNYLPNYATPSVKDSAFPPLYEQTVIRPTKHISLSSQAHFSTQKGIFLDSVDSVSFNYPYYGISLNYVMIKKPETLFYTSNSLGGKVYFYPVKNLYIGISAQKDILNNYYPYKTYTIKYTENCWAVGISIFDNEIAQQNSNGTYTRTRNIGAWITLSLNGIGTISRRY